jgi:hypothetical protein
MISRIKSRQSRLVIPFDPNRNYKASSVTSSHMVCDVSINITYKLFVFINKERLNLIHLQKNGKLICNQDVMLKLTTIEPSGGGLVKPEAHPTTAR